MNLISYLFNHIFTYPIFNVLILLYHLFGDFGLSIIVLTIVIFIALFPLTRRQLKAMKAMLALRSELAEIRKQYAQDLRAQREATKALYKQHGVSPPSTFLSLLVQAPIFGGLFLALNTVLNHATLTNLNHIIYPFLPQLTSVPNIDLNWFTIFNSAWHFSLGMPDPTHVLPILAGIVTFVQMRMSQPHNITEIRDAMMQLTQLVQFILPLILAFVTIFIAWQLAAGLALYRTTSLLLNMIQQSFVTGWGSLLTVPHLAGFPGNSSARSNTPPAQQARLQSKSSSTKGHIRRRGASARRRGRTTKKRR